MHMGERLRVRWSWEYGGWDGERLLGNAIIACIWLFLTVCEPIPAWLEAQGPRVTLDYVFHSPPAGNAWPILQAACLGHGGRKGGVFRAKQVI